MPHNGPAKPQKITAALLFQADPAQNRGRSSSCRSACRSEADRRRRRDQGARRNVRKALRYAPCRTRYLHDTRHCQDVPSRKSSASHRCCELGIRPEQGIATGRAVVGPKTFVIPVFAGKSPFGFGKPGHGIEFRREHLFPDLVRQIKPGSIGAGVVGILRMIVAHGVARFRWRSFR